MITEEKFLLIDDGGGGGASYPAPEPDQDQDPGTNGTPQLPGHGLPEDKTRLEQSRELQTSSQDGSQDQDGSQSGGGANYQQNYEEAQGFPDQATSQAQDPGQNVTTAGPFAGSYGVIAVLVVILILFNWNMNK